MDKKGFTLIELLVVIVIIGLLGVYIVPNVFEALDKTKQEAYSNLIENVVVAAKMYYSECEYGDLSDEKKYGEYACNIDDAKIVTTLGALANTGFLTVSNIQNGNTVKVLDPKNDTDISDCEVTIVKSTSYVSGENGITYTKVSYSISANKSQHKCPSSY